MSAPLPRLRVSVDDLALAATWCEAYEAEEGDENAAALLRVAAWLLEEAQRRQDAQTVRSIAKQTGGTLAQARESLRWARELRAGK